jgi:hypothetical protein
MTIKACALVGAARPVGADLGQLWPYRRQPGFIDREDDDG